MSVWRVVVKPKNAEAERKLNVAWRTKRPVEVSPPVVPYEAGGRRRSNLIYVYETIVAAELAVNAAALATKYHKRLARMAVAGLRVVNEIELAGERVFVRSSTGERVAAVVRSLPEHIVRRVHEKAIAQAQATRSRRTRAARSTSEAVR